jgi:hypothetical protein
MGAWGANSFDNDTANDWAYGLEDVEDLSLVSAAITAVLTVGTDYLDAGFACEAIAACEVIARLKGNWGERDAYTEEVDSWVAAHPIQPPRLLVDQALQSIDRILAPKSELMELWDEGGRNEEWHAKMDDLRARVAGD